MTLQKEPATFYNQPCPCGSGRIFSACCGHYITLEELAPTAELLMRSRYSAYVLGNDNYLLRNWHETTRPSQLNSDTDEGLNWLSLRILACDKGGGKDTEGTVEFVAEYQLEDEVQQLHEKSRFVNENGQWFYLDGEIKPTPNTKTEKKTGRNEPCPCGSDKKYKRCCG